jgi:hypothetical protein
MAIRRVARGAAQDNSKSSLSRIRKQSEMFTEALSKAIAALLRFKLHTVSVRDAD